MMKLITGAVEIVGEVRLRLQSPGVRRTPNPPVREHFESYEAVSEDARRFYDAQS